MNTRPLKAFSVASLLGLLCVTSASSVRAEGAAAGAEGAADAKASCGDAYEGAQEARGKAALLSAREQLLICSRDQCPKFIRTDCAKWLEQVTSAIPSLVIAVQDPDGNDLPDVQLEIDGKTVTESLSLALDIDPGEHTLSVSVAGFEPMSQTVVLREGEQRRRVDFVMQRPASAEPARPAASTTAPDQISTETAGAPALAYILGGVGVVAMGGFAYFALTGRSQRSDLESSCSPNCSQSKIDEVDQSFLFADISLGVGVVSLGVATYLLLSGSSDAPAASSARSLPLSLMAAPGGAFGAWRGTF